MKILVAPDKFKDCLDADRVAESIASGLRRIPGTETVCLPLADGGDGTARILGKCLGASPVTVDTVDALRRPLKAVYYIAGHTAVTDVSTASGIALLGKGEHDVMRADTYGTGLIVLDALRRGCTEIIIGLGGSATVDGGRGLMEALGLEPGQHPSADRCRFTLICDVDAPLCGPYGAAEVFGPQKGAKPAQVKSLERRLADMAAALGVDPDTPGLGAAGGFSLPLLACFPGRVSLRPGAEAVLYAVGFDRAAAGCDAVVTGEGHADAQTLMGKLPAEVMRRSRKAGIRNVVLMGGKVDNAEALHEAGFTLACGIHPPGMDAGQQMDPDITTRDLADTAYRIFSSPLCSGGKSRGTL